MHKKMSCVNRPKAEAEVELPEMSLTEEYGWTRCFDPRMRRKRTSVSSGGWASEREGQRRRRRMVRLDVEEAVEAGAAKERKKRPSPTTSSLEE